MPGTIQVLEELDGYAIDRFGVLITRSTLNGDPELISLVTLTRSRRPGERDPHLVPVVTADAPSFPDDVPALLAAPPDDAIVVAPTTVPPTTR